MGLSQSRLETIGLARLQARPIFKAIWYGSLNGPKKSRAWTKKWLFRQAGREPPNTRRFDQFVLALSDWSVEA
jgi:hypothetical protein